MNEQAFNVFVDIDGNGNQIPEPVYEYRVVCDDGVARYFVGTITDEAVADQLRREATRRGRCTALPIPHRHTVERRSVGPWEMT